MRDGKMEEKESKNGLYEGGRRVFGVVCRGSPDDFQAWLNSAQTYGIFVIFSKASRIGKLIIKEVPWE